MGYGAPGRIAREGSGSARDLANEIGPATLARKRLGRERIPGLALGHRKTHREVAQWKALRQLASSWRAPATPPVSAETQNCHFQDSKQAQHRILLAIS